MTELLTSTERSDQSPTTDTSSGHRDDQHEYHDMKWVPWYAALLCQFGIHSGNWVYVTDGNCSQLRACRHCGKTRVRTKHQREWQYIYSSLCEQMKVCRRCGAGTGRHRIKHVWGASFSMRENTDAHRCERCGDIETWRTWDGDYTCYD